MVDYGVSCEKEGGEWEEEETEMGRSPGPM